MELSTKHLKLRPIQLSDVDDIFTNFTDDLTKYMYVKAPKDKIETIQFVQKSIQNYENKQEIVFTVLDQKTDEFLGLIGAHDIHTKTPELGLWLKKASQGNKYGLEGLKEVIAYLKSRDTFDYFIYRCDERNYSSRDIAFSLSGIPIKTYQELNEKNFLMHYVEFHIFINEAENFNYPVLLFQGDSITDCNRKREQPYDLGHGYVNELVKMIDHAIFINKGISGNRTVDLLERWSYDTIALKPDFLSILVGINEVWHHYKYGNVLTPEQYRVNYIKLLERVKHELPKTKILMIQPFVFPIGEYEPIWQDDLNQEQKIVVELAEKYADYYIPMQDVLNKALEKHTMGDILGDGVHPSDLGHLIMAKQIKQVLYDFMILYYAQK